MAQRGNSQLERRSAERYAVSLSVRTDRGPGVTRDVSTSGLCLVIEQPLEVGDQMEVVLTIPDPVMVKDHAHVELSFQGRVVRVDPGSMAVGVQILSNGGNRQLAWSF
jgi:hypothetical protein